MSTETALNRSSIVNLIYYPIKACKGVTVPEIQMERTGLNRDRLLMLTYEGGRFVSQREPKNQQLALVEPKYLDEDLLEVTAPGVQEKLRIKVKFTGETSDSSVHSSLDIKTVDQGDEASIWFSNFLGKKVRLVAKHQEYRRPLKPHRMQSAEDQTGLSDGAPVLLTAIESLVALNKMLPYKVPMSRFRPNIVISGSELPFAEDEAKKLLIGEVQMRIVDLCTRCVTVTTDQDRGVLDDRESMQGEPLKTLVRTRMIHREDGEKGGAFGVNVVPETLGMLAIGMSVKALEMQPAPLFILPKSLNP